MKKMSTRRMAVWGLNLIVFFFCSSLALAQDQDLIPQPGKPLTLDQVRAIAIKFHPSLVATKETVLANKALVEQALAAYYPQVNFNNSYTAFTTNFSSSPISNPSGGAIGVPTAGP